MFKQIFTSALFAGIAAGLLSALLQFWLVTPVLLEGEEYETGAKNHYAGVLIVEGEDPAPVEVEVETPPTTSELIVRHGMTVAMNIIVFTGFALILVAGIATAASSGHEVTAKSGIVWGLAGFIAVQLAPAAGLFPELPGTPAEDIILRQMWWITAVVATLVGLALIAFGNRAYWMVLGAAFVAAPHIIGAPHLEFYAGVAPPELSALFVSRSLAVACASWAIMGGVAGAVWHRQTV
ncbi:CbtA family protein [Falsihalocynthiibacter sp. S25ZX9]|uniref:CbtA family protein n=1 Tax=Falsihalocynthiibacter sp. S25ZX9 TaxID=3240870 RepID=UPI00350F57C6